MPGNAALFFGFLLQIASFDIIPMSNFYDWMFPSKQLTSDVLSPNFAQLGITSTLFLYNLGSLILAFVAVPVVLLAYPVLIPCKRFDRVEKIRHSIWTATFFNHTIRTIVESYVILVVCVCINTLDVSPCLLTFIAGMDKTILNRKLNICSLFRRSAHRVSVYSMHLRLQAFREAGRKTVQRMLRIVLREPRIKEGS
jgi:hypothetical protein